MKGKLGKAGALLLALVAMPASAGTLYRCVGADGVSSYVNKRIPGSPWAEAALMKTQGLMLQNKTEEAKKLAAEVESTASDPETKHGAQIHLAAVDALAGR